MSPALAEALVLVIVGWGGLGLASLTAWIGWLIGTAPDRRARRRMMAWYVARAARIRRPSVWPAS